ncbi:MAG: hypothetical protein HFI19_14050 [Lachnospiraceae bacterium]|nr:hypothetical protein [Lachnospiraceae bacterium]
MEEYLGMMKWLQELCDEKGIQLLPVAEKVIKLLEENTKTDIDLVCNGSGPWRFSQNPSRGILTSLYKSDKI